MQEDPKAVKVIPMPLPKGQVYHKLAFSPDSVLAAAFGRNIHFWDVGTGNLIGEIIDAHSGDITCMQWSPQEAVLATGAADGHVMLWRSPLDLYS